MPKSRTRRPRNQRRHSTKSRRRRYDEARAVRRGSVGDALGQLTPTHRANMRAAADAELRGDAAAALDHYEAIPMFIGSVHHGRLRQLAELSDEAPGWLLSRWLTVQARRPLWSGARSDGPDPALSTTLRVAYPHGVEAARMEDFSPETFLATLCERDWVLRQLVVFERGGLRGLVDGLASRELLARADHAEAWPDATMGGYRFDSDDHGELQLTDLADGARVDVLDLGLAAEHWPGTHFLGRLVPTSAGPGRMFEWRPLPVDEGTARLVAERPDAWLSTVAARARDETLPCMFSYQEDSSMTSDLPVRSWLGLLDPEEVAELPMTDGLIDFEDVALFVLGKVLRLLRSDAPELIVVRHFAEALLLEPGLSTRIRERFGRPRFAPAWAVLAGIVREPARSRCLRLAVREDVSR